MGVTIGERAPLWELPSTLATLGSLEHGEEELAGAALEAELTT